MAPRPILSWQTEGGKVESGKTMSQKVYQFVSVAQLCLTLRNPTDCSMPGFPVHHQLPELTQTHVHQVSDAIRPPHPAVPFSSPLQSFPASESFLMNQSFASGGQSIKSLSFSISPSKEHSGLISFRIDWLDLLSPRDFQESSPTPQFKSINSSVLGLLYSPTLTSIHEFWKNHSFD